MTVALLLLASLLQVQTTLLVTVVSDGTPVPQAEVSVGALLVVTDDRGVAELALDLDLDLDPDPDIDIEAREIVTATRSDRRIEDVPMRVEVVPADEVQEKIMMTPGDISMLLAETNGLRLQTTSPSLGGASVRIQGLRGRYTQTLADGLPLFGSTGSIGLLQIPPMDLGQVEVIKGVASALYGASAVGGVINLVSRRPQADEREREVLLNTTSHGGTDAVLWLSSPLNERWGATFVVGRWLVGDHVVSVRGSATSQRHTHVFGPVDEPDRHGTRFGEASMTGTTRGHTWVGGVAVQQDTYRSATVPRFDYTFTVPGVFVQDDYDPVDWVSLSASARVDAHSGYGTFLSPRVSGLVRWGGPWQTRVSVGRGFFAPTPFENISDIRQTRYNPLTRPFRNPDGRWTVDAWAPLEGRTLNAGTRWRF